MCRRTQTADAWGMEQTSSSRTAPGVWIGLIAVAVVTVVIVGIADFLVMFGQSSTCDEAPHPDAVRTGQLGLGIVLLGAALPWSLGAVMSRHRVPVAVVGAFAVLPALVIFLNGLRTDAWVGSFCF